MKIEIVCACPFCGKGHSVFTSEEGYFNWMGGELIQNALPELTPSEREQLISGLCPACQEKIFGKGD